MQKTKRQRRSELIHCRNADTSSTDVESLHILDNHLRKFGTVGAVSHQAIDGLDECAGRGKKLDTDEIAVGLIGGFEVPDAGVGDRGLAVEHQANGLDRFNRERLMGFDQRAVVCEVVNTHRVPGIERSPERSKHFETNSRSAITRRAHHAFGHSAKPLVQGVRQPRKMRSHREES